MITPNSKHVILDFIHEYVDRDINRTHIYYYKLLNLLKANVEEINNYFKLLLLSTDDLKLLLPHIKYFKLVWLITYSEIDLCKNYFVEIHKKKDLHDKRDELLPISYSTLYICKCGHNKTRVREFQTRSIDEGTTLMAQCISCGNTWRPNY